MFSTTTSGWRSSGPRISRNSSGFPLVMGADHRDIDVPACSLVIGTMGSVLDCAGPIQATLGCFRYGASGTSSVPTVTIWIPKAAVQVEPFTPPVFGHKMVGQFEVWSYPSPGTWLMAGLRRNAGSQGW